MANTRGKEVDTTSLSLDHAEKRGFIHRDYLAHCLRWSHVVNYLHGNRRHQSLHIIDVGCGKEAPLAKLMFSSRLTHTTGSYTGVDYGKLSRPESIAENTTKFNAKFLGGVDFAKDKLPREQYDMVTCFEVLEHVEPFHAYSMLKRMRQVLAKSGGFAFISTPCYDEKVGAANNHVNEMTFAGLKAIIEMAGLEIVEVHGTFASQRDYKHLMTPGQKEVFDRLSGYYDSSIISCMFAPMFPQHSRNCCWRLKPAKSTIVPCKKTMDELLKPHHSNSQRWATDLKKIAADAKKGVPF